jgi:hypothetical protein
MKIRKFVFIWICALLLLQCNRKANPVAEKKSAPVSKNVSSKPVSSAKGVENFDNFYQRFHKDSLFQISRVQFPLKGEKVNLKGTSPWKKEKWMMIKATANEVDRNEFSVKTLKKSDSYFEGVYCKNCGFSFEMEYRLVNGKWYLVYLQENDL